MIIYLKSSKFVCVKAFPMYGGIGVSVRSLHRESTDSLIHVPFCEDRFSYHHGNMELLNIECMVTMLVDLCHL